MASERSCTQPRSRRRINLIASLNMSQLDEPLQRWVVDAVAPGSMVTKVRGLRDGGSPWLIVFDRADSPREVILRVGSTEARSLIETEIAALELASEHALPAPRLLAADADGDPPLIVIDRLPGSSTIPSNRSRERLRRLGAEAARLSGVRLASTSALPLRDRPISGVDFKALRRTDTTPLLERAESTLMTLPAGEAGFVHGDLWQGNSLWRGDELMGLIDWDCAGVGPAGLDLGSLRLDAALCFGLEAVNDPLDGWEEAAGRSAADVAHWDIVAALSTPADMGWFFEATVAQGRPDLTRSLLIQRRDAFLEAAMQS